MADTEKRIKSTRKKHKKCRAKEQAVLAIVSVRISDEEKQHIDELMRAGIIKRYSDVLRMAIQMIQVQKNDEAARSVSYH